MKLWHTLLEMPVLSRTDQGKPVETCSGSWRVAVYWSHYTRWVPHVVIKRHFSWSGKLETQGTNWGNSFSSFCTKWLLLSWSIHILEHLKLRWIHVVSHAWQIKIKRNHKEKEITFSTFHLRYRKYIEKDPALERRFQPVILSAPRTENRQLSCDAWCFVRSLCLSPVKRNPWKPQAFRNFVFGNEEVEYNVEGSGIEKIRYNIFFNKKYE